MAGNDCGKSERELPAHGACIDDGKVGILQVGAIPGSDLTSQGNIMPSSSKRSTSSPGPIAGPLVTMLTERPQIEFEMDFFESLLTRIPDFAEVLQAQAGNLTSQGRMMDGLKVDQRIVTLKPSDPMAHYNLACRYALMKQQDQALTALAKAIELGYRDFRYMIRDEDLASIRKDPRFRQMVKEYTAKRSR
ncbi:hypothetical protein BH11PLA2_BH11PLA2_37780 [soil metagenome]